MKYLGTLFCITALFIAASSCKKDTDPTAEQILGRWELQEGFRNGRPTESLSDLFFEFRTEGQMSTNLPITDIPSNATYVAKKGKIEQQQGDMELEYQIEQLNDSVLILTTKLRNFDFRFVLKKM
jgi:hypothetical protein